MFMMFVLLCTTSCLDKFPEQIHGILCVIGIMPLSAHLQKSNIFFFAQLLFQRVKMIFCRYGFGRCCQNVGPAGRLPMEYRYP